MRIPRFRIRTLMIVVVVAAVTFGGFRALTRLLALKQLSKVYSVKAAECAWYERENAKIADDCEDFLKRDPLPETYEEFLKAKPDLVTQAQSNVPYNEVAMYFPSIHGANDYYGRKGHILSNAQSRVRQIGPRNRRVADHYANMKSKYEEAAGRPWLPVAPDPPPPE